MNENLIQAISRQRCKGIMKAGDFLQTPDDAIPFIQDLARVGVVIIGCNLWEPWNQDRTKFLEMVGGGDLVNPRLTLSDARRNGEILTAFLTNEWPPDAERISLVYADPAVHDMVMQYAKCE